MCLSIYILGPVVICSCPGGGGILDLHVDIVEHFHGSITALRSGAAAFTIGLHKIDT